MKTWIWLRCSVNARFSHTDIENGRPVPRERCVLPDKLVSGCWRLEGKIVHKEVHGLHQKPPCECASCLKLCVLQLAEIEMFSISNLHHTFSNFATARLEIGDSFKLLSFMQTTDHCGNLQVTKVGPKVFGATSTLWPVSPGDNKLCNQSGNHLPTSWGIQIFSHS